MPSLPGIIIDRPHGAEAEDAFFRLTSEVEKVTELYRHLHANPRVSGDEGDTLRTLMDELPAAFEKETLPGNVGIVRIGEAGPSVAIRAEMDALPILEETDLPWAATTGAMHACGHDVHMAAFVAVARTIAAMTVSPAPLVGILQPREEVGDSGAHDVLRAGVLDTHDIGAVIGAHLQPALESKAFSCTSGPVNAAADEFKVVFAGQASHGAYPHHSSDPLLAVSAFVVSCQQIVARNVDPTQSAVLTVGTIKGGSSPNAIPDSAEVTGTIRTMSEEQRLMVQRRLREVANGIAAAHDCAVRLEIRKGEPILRNDPELAAEIERLLDGQGHTLREFRSYGSDDFAFYASAARAVMIFTGTEVEAGNLHSNTFTPDAGAISRVATAMLTGYLAAAHILKQHGPVHPSVS
ncbi:amidohydrolase [Paenarthrobacter ureafaciens]|uniref:M20 metallopeptidase family protein n=1 Tax=Paenarthrobacter ureafaciens TaxID=37931 RepID=UPI0015B79897|nr:M20 family metallopeptidase [Paenarthrobacter ureafaciens]NWL26622.1 amidohydrolase [Paenarthrobacter ureafaciens]